MAYDTYIDVGVTSVYTLLNSTLTSTSPSRPLSVLLLISKTLIRPQPDGQITTSSPKDLHVKQQNAPTNYHPES